MKKITFFNKTLTLFLLLALLFSSSVFAQLVVPFTPRLPGGSIRVQGDILFVGNSIITGEGLPQNFNTRTGPRSVVNNNSYSGTYINVASGGDPDIFSSSTADLQIDNTCNSILYAGLYWSTIYPVDFATNQSASYEGTTRFEDWNQIKFKLPTGDFIDLVADNAPDPVGEEDEIILDGLVRNPNGSIDQSNTVLDAPIVCYKNVTGLLQGLGIGQADGTYTVANLRATNGRRRGGCAGGWVMVVVYESPSEPSRFISTFDGYSRVSGTQVSNIDISGFQTLPAPLPVNANIGVAALEGDIGFTGDSFSIKANTSIGAPTFISDVINEAGNFFNSSITREGVHVTNRNPSSLNTLGFDIKDVVIQNPNRLVIPNDETEARLTLRTNGDAYGAFMTSFSVEIIEPKIILSKLVEDVGGVDIRDQTVGLGDELNYILQFQNQGNDDAIDYIIRDVLPINVDFNFPEDVISLPNGVRVRSYDAQSREIIFEIDNNLVTKTSPLSDPIRLRVSVVSTCSLLDDACSNIVTNQAFSTYRGVDNPTFLITDDPSFSIITGCLIAPQATNFLSDLNCTFEEEVILCGDSTVLRAGDGYDTYTWSRNPSGTPVIGTEQTLTVTEPGTYYSFNVAIQPCQNIDQRYDVITFGADVDNPLIPDADQVVQCPNDGLEMPNYFLCGANDTRFIQTAITDANSIIWEVLDENSCPSVRDQANGSMVIGLENCPNENDTCVWNQVQTGPDFTIDTQGQYRITLNYNGGCFNRFYFNVFENIFEPTETHSDIVCNTPGEIRVGNVPSGYEFSLDDNEPRTYQASNVFTVPTAGNYTVYIRQIGIMPNPCIFTIPNIQIGQRNFQVTSVLTQPACNGELGTIVLSGNDANPQYTFTLSQDVNNTTVVVDTFGPDSNNTHTFSGVRPGIYTINVTTADGCTDPQIVEIINPPLLTATANLTVPLTCSDGEITVPVEGGTPPYAYFVNSTTVFQTNNTIPVTQSGTFNIRVVDANDCFVDTSISVDENLPPDFNITKTDILCDDTGDSGNININIINSNGYTVDFSIDNGVNFTASPNFTSLPAGSYDVVVRYQLQGDQGTVNNTVNDDDVDPQIDPVQDFCLTTVQVINIAPPTSIQATATLTTPYSCTTTGVITLSGITGGTPPYTYSIDGINFQPGLIFPNLTDGAYTITVQDANSCTFVTTPVIIAPLDPPTALSFTNTALTCPDMTTTVTVTATNGRAPLEYRLVSGPNNITRPFQTTNTFTGLEAGTYRFEVRDADNCILDNTFNIAPLPILTIQEEVLNDITCFDDTDGSARFTVIGTTNFTYTVNNGPVITGTTVINLTNLAAQAYTVNITDTDTNCSVSATVTINAPTAPLAVTANESVISCIEPGRVVANATGGWGGNTYRLTRPDTSVTPIQNSNIFTNLSQAGTYTLTVIDNRGCEATDTFTLTTPVNPTATISSTSDVCFDGANAATLQVDALGGQPPYEYNVNGGPFRTNNIFANLTPGAYDIIVRDALGCTVALPREFIQEQLTISAVLNKNLDCSINPDASFTATFTGGAAPHTATVSVSTDGGTTFTTTNLGTVTSPFNYTTNNPGIYRFEITDANSCTAVSNTNTVNPLVLPEITSVTLVNPILCNGDANASINIVINNNLGTPAFSLNITNTTTNTNFGTQTSGLPAGDYTVTLTDANFCTDVETINIPQPEPVNFILDSTPIQCDPNSTNGSSLGTITVRNVTGGVAPFRYFINNNFNTTIPGSPYVATAREDFTFNVIDFGEYTVNVIDANGCNLIQRIIMVSPPDDLLINIDTMPGSCATGGTAVVQATNQVGAGNYEFGILESPTAPYTMNFLPPDIPGGETRTFTNLIPGVRYTFVVREITTQCVFVRTADVAIPEVSPLTVSLETNNVACVGENNGSVTFTLDNFDSTTTNIDFEVFQAFTNTPVVPSTQGMTPVTFGTPVVVTVPNPGALPPGQYFIVFTETGSGSFNGCRTASEIFEITESALPLELTTSIDKNANCNVNSGRISGIATNGTSPYLYQVTTTPAAPLPTDSLWDTPSTFNLDANTYYIHVQDANGCIVTSPPIVLPQDPEPVVTAALVEQCNIDNGNFQINVTLTNAGIAPHAYSIDGGVFQTRVAPFTLSNLTAGNHTIEVQDSNGCGNLVNVNIETPLGLTPEVTQLASCNTNDGIITVTGNGGSGNYNYSITPTNSSITLNANVFSGVPSGSYTVRITDVITSCTTTANVTLEAPTDVTFTTTSTNVSCNGGSDGIITVNLPASNDNPVYTYEITAPIVVAPQTSNIFTGLPANTYTIRVTSGRNCILTQDADPIEEPDPIVITPTATSFACNTNNVVNTALLTINQTGGTPPFVYSLDNTSFFTTNTFNITDTGALQTLNIFVRDNNGCTETTTIDIQPLATITDATVTTTAAIDCNQTGQVTINVTGGSAPGNLTYQLLPDGVPQASNVFAINAPGDYSFRIDDSGTGCFFITNTPFTVAPFDNADVVLTPTNGVTCFGDTDGSFTLDITGYTGPYTYEVFNNNVSISGPITANTTTNPQTISNIAAGNIMVTVTETNSPFCESMSNTITINSPTAPLTLMANQTSNVTCDDNLGTITAIASGGWGNYQYELTGAANVAFSSSGVFTGLSQGNYVVNVRDANGCIVSSPVTLALPDMITATVTANTTLLDCFGDTDAVITATNVLGGQGRNYSYILNTILPAPATSGPTQNPVFPNLGAGTYNVTIIDGFNCSFTSPDIVIQEPTQIESALIQQTSATCLIDATLTISASGGTPPYQYSLSNTFNIIEGNFTTDVTFAVTPGLYQYFVRDANGCSFNPTNQINVEGTPMLVVNIEDQDVDINCLGDNNGFIRASAEGGLGNYVYTLQDATTGTNIAPVTQDTPGAFSNLPAGNYRVQVTSGDCLANSIDVTITEPQNPLIATFNKTDVTCFGENNGSLEIVASGGTGIIKYAIGPGQGQTFSPFLFSLELGQFFESPIFNNLPPGDFQAIAQDENGCLQFMDFTIEPAVPIVATVVPNSIIPEICSGDQDGVFTLNVTGGVMPYSVAIDNINGPYTTGLPGQTDFDFTGLTGGQHTVYVRDALNCETEWDVTLPESVILNPIPVVSYTCDTSLTAVVNTVFVAVDVSNTDLSQLDYSLDGVTYQASNTFNNLPVGLNNTIFVRHSNGCIKQTDPFEVIDYQPLEVTISDGNINEIVATATGGSGVYDFEIETLFTSTREPVGDTNTFRFFESGEYIVTVTDSFGCTATATRFFEFIDICILNYFTPNGDGNLDLWGPGCVQDFENLTFDIFDRYGRKIATLFAGELWDGKYNGVELPSGDYWYVIKLNDEFDDREFVGNFTLYR